MKLIKLAVLVLLLGSCSKNADEKNAKSSSNQSINEEKRYVVDSLFLNDSIKLSNTLSAKFSQQVLVFENLDSNALDSLFVDVFETTKKLDSYLKIDLQKDLQNARTYYFNDVKLHSKEFMPEFPQVWDYNSSMHLHSIFDKYLTVKYTGYGFTGGAHGYAYENYKTVDVESSKTIDLDDIVDISKIDWNKLLLQYLGERKGELFDKEELTFSKNFYFSSKEIVFIYNQYEIAPYSSGIIKISVPMNEIIKYKKPSFKHLLANK